MCFLCLYFQPSQKCPTSDKLCLADKRAFKFNRSLRHFPRFYKRHSSEFRFAQRFCSVIHQPCVQAGLSFQTRSVVISLTKVNHTPRLQCLDGACLESFSGQPPKCNLPYYEGGCSLHLMYCNCHKTLFSRMSSNVGTSCLSVANLSSAGLTPGSLHRSARSLSTIQVKPVHL